METIILSKQDYRAIRKIHLEIPKGMDRNEAYLLAMKFAVVYWCDIEYKFNDVVTVIYVNDLCTLGREII